MRLLWLYENIRGYSFDGLSTCDPKNIERERSHRFKISSLNAIDILDFNFKFSYIYFIFLCLSHCDLNFFFYIKFWSILLIILTLKKKYISEKSFRAELQGSILNVQQFFIQRELTYFSYFPFQRNAILRFLNSQKETRGINKRSNDRFVTGIKGYNKHPLSFRPMINSINSTDDR